MKFPIYRRPGGVVFVDDDPAYLEMLGDVMPQHWPVRLFGDPRGFVNHLQQDPPRWEADIWSHQTVVDRWREGHAIIPQILRYWRDEPQRHALIQVCVVDYSMPGMNGLHALAELLDWPGSRVLLTGRADEQIAVEAFNRGLIEQFVPKQIPDLARRLTEIVQRLLDLPGSRHDAIWRGTLTPSQHALIRVPSVGRDLHGVLRQTGWVEHVVIGEPFGVLGLDAVGRASWLQLEQPESLLALSELAQSQGIAREQVQAIRDGAMLVDLELQLALGGSGPPRIVEAFRIGQANELRGALFAIDAQSQPGEPAGFNRYLESMGQRHIVF